MKRIFLLVILFLNACSQQGTNEETTTISATACANRNSDGEITECEPSIETKAYLKKMLAESNRIDEEHPGPIMPDIENLFDVQRIGDDGSIYLKNGTVLALAGLSCDHPDLVKYLRAFFIEPFQHKLTFLETGYQANGKVYAYMWEVDAELDEEQKENVLSFGPMVSPINENALTSGWCHPIKQDNHIYHERYMEIEKLSEIHEGR